MILLKLYYVYYNTKLCNNNIYIFISLYIYSIIRPILGEMHIEERK